MFAAEQKKDVLYAVAFVVHFVEGNINFVLRHWLEGEDCVGITWCIEVMFGSATKRHMLC